MSQHFRADIDGSSGPSGLSGESAVFGAPVQCPLCLASHIHI